MTTDSCRFSSPYGCWSLDEEWIRSKLSIGLNVSAVAPVLAKEKPEGSKVTSTNRWPKMSNGPPLEPGREAGGSRARMPTATSSARPHRRAAVEKGWKMSQTVLMFCQEWMPKSVAASVRKNRDNHKRQQRTEVS
ncbi:hypothetical protein ZHAS_00007165 [Anopheles sinensis]|uniref:Uncharacterized protein n=1 Tax=Anopheles sinensis TaxID=74873 RepID=A0A084VPA4_ANOSI|nr:hypothetical protein ZHAS_00007165 [Anopheles sinensis]